MTAQDLIERLALLQLREQEAKTQAAEYVAERERLALEYARRIYNGQGMPPVAVS